MHPVAAAEIEAVRPALVELCARYAVERLWVFGSAVGEEFNPEESDLDFLVEFGEPKGMGRLEQYMDLIAGVRRLFSREVHVCDWRAAKNPYFRRNAEAQRRELYAA